MDLCCAVTEKSQNFWGCIPEVLALFLCAGELVKGEFIGTEEFNVGVE
jgi:hypothetical protein